jgi:hypothetical protein
VGIDGHGRPSAQRQARRRSSPPRSPHRSRSPAPARRTAQCAGAARSHSCPGGAGHQRAFRALVQIDHALERAGVDRPAALAHEEGLRERVAGATCTSGAAGRSSRRPRA